LRSTGSFGSEGVGRSEREFLERRLLKRVVEERELFSGAVIEGQL
jgi:hypothetical protein